MAIRSRVIAAAESLGNAPNLLARSVTGGMGQTQARTQRLRQIPNGRLIRPTMRDVARVAGVSLKSVSRVINGDAGVSSELTACVEAAVSRLQYQQNLHARTLRRADSKSGTIGLLMADAANPFCAQLHRAIEDEALDRGVLVFTGSSDQNREREHKLMSAFSGQRVDGLIIVATTRDAGLLARERLTGTAVVIVDGSQSDPDVDCVVTDDYLGVRIGVAHLIDQGHRHIAYLGPRGPADSAARRYQGFIDELNAHGVRLEPRLVRLNLADVGETRSAAAELVSLSCAPTALFTANCATTMGCNLAVQASGLGLRVAVVGFDDGLHLDSAEARITVVARDPTAMGHAAARLLFRRIDGDPSHPVHVTLPPKLIPRGSGEIDVTDQDPSVLARPRLAFGMSPRSRATSR